MRIAILTNFEQFCDWFSLCRVVADQATLLTRFGHDVTVCVGESCQDSTHGGPYRFAIDQIIPKPPHQDEHPSSLSELTTKDHAFSADLASLMTSYLQPFDMVITHDWLLVGPLLPYAEALRLMAPHTRHLRFLHWIHSIPSQGRDWWTINRYGHNHMLIYPNKTDLDQVAQMFCTGRHQARAFPHVVDLRTLYEFSEHSWNIIDSVPGLMSADFVQIYPISADRMSDKGLKKLIYVFKELKNLGRSVCLLVADAWTGRFPRQDKEQYRRIADRNDMAPDEFGFTSDLAATAFTNGLPRWVLRELMQISNLFVYPTEAETFGLVLVEACLGGGVFPVLNRSLSIMREVGGNYGLYVNFGSCEKQLSLINEREHYERIARQIVAVTGQDDAFQARTWMRQTYNMDAIYKRYYEPLLLEGWT